MIYIYIWQTTSAVRVVTQCMLKRRHVSSAVLEQRHPRACVAPQKRLQDRQDVAGEDGCLVNDDMQGQPVLRVRGLVGS